VLRLLHAAGVPTRTLSRRPEAADKLRAFTSDVRLADATDPAAIAGAAEGCDVVLSAVGAAVSPARGERRGYEDVDLFANRNLLAEAKRAGARRFVYVGVWVEDGYRDVAYVRAHEVFIDELRASGLPFGVVRPTGVFGALAELVAMAKKGRVPLIGGGSARSNPVHEADVAEACVEAIGSADPALDLGIGGPDVLTRREVAELAFAAARKPPRFVPAAPWMMRAGAALVSPFDRRLAELFRFVTAVSTTDAVAPKRGERRLADYFDGIAGRG
jgi:uncharacterized protein YbjT (DUF2867 family)